MRVSEEAPRATTGPAIVRPGTAKSFNVILDPNTFDRFKLVVLGERFLLIDGVLQNVDDVVSAKAARVAALPATALYWN